jgi:RNA polymerase sigma factor (sigma-70 family)
MSPARKTAPRCSAAVAPLDILDLLARCVVGADNTAWGELLQYIQPLAKSKCRLISSEQREEFAAWLPGWPRLTQTLGCAYKKVRNELDADPSLDESKRQGFFCAYFTHVIRSAKIDFLKEHTPHTFRDDPLEEDSRLVSRELSLGDKIALIKDKTSQPSRLADIADQRACLKAALKKLAPASRAAFLMTFAPDELGRDDFAWIAKETGRTVTETETLIEAERAAHCDAQYPLSSQFIADLLGLQQDTVSQRVRRARLQLAALLGDAR